MSESQLYKESAEAGRPELSAGSAAWLHTRRGAIEVGPASYTPPKENEITVKNGAVAINPLDWGIQLAGQAAPEPHVVGHGLRHIQAALDAQLKSVSAAKIVVSLDAR
jgi:hypothetical protein